MPPKKKDKKAKAKAKGGAGAGEVDVLELKRQIVDAEVQLREELRVIDRLTRENANKADQLKNLEDLLHNEREKHAEELDLVQQEARTITDGAEHDVETLSSKARQMEVDLEAYGVIERERDQLRERVQTLLDDMQSESKEHAEQVHAMKKEAFSLRMQLELTFRKSLQDLDGLYQKKAFEAMTEQSRNALMTNANLREELQVQSISVENLLRRYKRQEKSLKDMKIAKDTLEKTHEMQIKQIAALKRHQYEYESRLSDMQVALARLSTEQEQERAQQQRQGPDQLAQRLAEAEAEAAKYRGLYEKAQMRSVKWKARAFELSRKCLQQTRVDKVNASLALRESIASDPALGSPESRLHQQRSRDEGSEAGGSEGSLQFGRTDLDSYEQIIGIWRSDFPTASHRASTSSSSSSSFTRLNMPNSFSTPAIRSQTAVPASRASRASGASRGSMR